MTEAAAAQPTYDKKKLWKLVLLVVPALLSGASSYAKSRAEATDQAKATFEHMETDIDALQEAVAKVVEVNYVQTAEIAVLKEQLEAANKRAEAAHHWAAMPPAALPMAKPPRPADIDSADADGIPDAPKAGPDSFQRRKPTSFDSVVQSYKSKK